MTSETDDIDRADEARRYIIAKRRLQGRTYQDIAGELDLPVSLIRREAKPALESLCETSLAEASQQRCIEAARIDAAQAAIWPSVEAGSLDAVDRFVKLSTRRCALLGLDAPTKHEVSGEVRYVLQNIKDRLTMAMAEVCTEEQIGRVLILLDAPREIEATPVAFDVRSMVEMDEPEKEQEP